MDEVEKTLRMEFQGRLLKPQTASQHCRINCVRYTEELDFNAHKLHQGWTNYQIQLVPVFFLFRFFKVDKMN